MLTFETAAVQGVSGIIEKLTVNPLETVRAQEPLANGLAQNLPFEKVVHQVSTLDAQPSRDDGILVLVTGALLVRWPFLIQCSLPILYSLHVRGALFSPLRHGAFCADHPPP